ncbi:hypothetical protein A9762_11100 [Pandoraea sp. ISTKB]|nr:hypothetical protein A9762_11100 [Pandoraea sp. ISTKB]
MAQPLEQWQVEEARARQREERENLERRCNPLGIIASSKIKPKATYLATEAAETTAEIVLTNRTGLTVIEVRAREDWMSVVDNHLDTLHAMLALGRIDAIHAENGSRVNVTAHHPSWGLTELAITRSDFEKFARVVGIEFERNRNKDVHSGQGQYDSMINIIGALYQLAAANKQAGQVRGIASNVAKLVSQRTGGSIDPKTVRRYLSEAKENGFRVEDEDSRENADPA